MEDFIKSSKGRVVLASVSGVLWGSAYPVLKTCFEQMNLVDASPTSRIAFAGMRFLVASIIIFAFYKWGMKETFRINIGYLKKIAVIGLFQTTLLYYFFYNGLAVTTGMKSAVLNASGSFFLVFLAHLFFRDDAISKKKMLGLLFGFIGIIVVNWGKSFTWDFSFLGEGYIILCCLVGAFGDILAKKLSRDEHPVLLTAGQMFLGSVLLLFIGRRELFFVAQSFTVLSITLFTYASVLSAVAFTLWFTVLKYNKAGEVAVFKFIIPVAGTFLSAMFLMGENLSINIIFGLIFVCLGIIFVNKEKTDEKNQNNIDEIRKI